MNKSDIAVIGLGVMGQNLALNIESRGYEVSVFNRTGEQTKKFVESIEGKVDRLKATYNIEELVSSLKSPRKIILMVKAGEAVDIVIEALLPLLEKGDIIMDGGNSNFKDTIRRSSYLEEKNILFLGTGISGGEEGALKGPSIMSGGSPEAWEQTKNILIDISAKVDEKIPCCDYIGANGSGHYVKMVHNGIEYGDMQLISETYYLMKELLGMTPEEMHNVYAEWNKRELNSYLIEITADILEKVDEETSKPLIDVILDLAREKGTGKWTSQESLELRVPTPTMSEALFARYMSAKKIERVEASKILKGPEKKLDINKEQMLQDIEKALYASKICSYAQGFDLLKQASNTYNWNLDFGNIALLWRRGCIIRAQFLNKIKEAYDNNKELNNLLLDPHFKQVIDKAQDSWRRVIAEAVKAGIPVPALSSALFYYDSYRNDRLWANMIQAQRDYFGSHTYERIDKEGFFHTEWKGI
ncbi:NADP-dependent phosphogluconate dehydrogenase [Clostridium sp. DJ247]|uniref:NADP-dependent phosphogluconate dehydrogenase n=1 Tax=Clostridium sp. DJ247 TaxID=2726188 RepID=UPI0016231A3C|nr:NADP-dependent phosphogluconate dehydrogenase [Clostridium sp. DJ247]MBC2582412.1 NADP-dependent phosphogluconate dehydrogenase [Clostridium sp. DJ247]